ncbi:MAG: MBL fold metallo-hydrolase [Gemmatimonadaceae bacterium]
MQSATFVELDDVRLLIDCGSAAVFRMAGLGLPWSAITHVALTHFHADHTSDLATLLFAWRWGQLPPRAEPATILGPAGTLELVQRHGAALGASMMEAVPDLKVLEVIPGHPVALGPTCTLEARKVPHTNESVAYSLTSGTARLVVSGDTAFDADFAAWAGGCDVLLCECSLPDALAHATHLTPRQCGAIAAIAQPRLLALTHFYPPVEQEDIAAQVREQFDGPVVLCHDGWTHDF